MKGEQALAEYLDAGVEELIRQIRELERLIAGWQEHEDDAEVRWALYLMRVSLEARRKRLAAMMH